jgi:hypothetical protein
VEKDVRIVEADFNQKVLMLIGLIQSMWSVVSLLQGMRREMSALMVRRHPRKTIFIMRDRCCRRMEILMKMLAMELK